MGQLADCFPQSGKIPNIAGVKNLIMSEKIAHHGKAVKRIREILGRKQEDLATHLGISQQAVSLLEAKEVIEPKLLDDVAKALSVPVDAIKNFTEDAAINIIASTLHDNAGSIFYNPTFNPLDKVVELYERMIKEKNDEIDRLRGGK
jgi:transcriptional regulator with XRE-family HTH domain